MSAAATLIASSVQGGDAVARDTPLVLALIGLLAAASGLVVIRLRRRRRSRRARPVGEQSQALTLMGELCPHGWQAQITLYGWGAPVPADAPAAHTPLVELEWKQFDEEEGHIAVARRVWAPTIEAALATMVDDRRTDIVLEEIERRVAEEDA
jgi:hypothetical protein